jgi:hypothetical protein
MSENRKWDRLRGAARDGESSRDEEQNMTIRILNALIIAALLCIVATEQADARSLRADAQGNGNDGWGCADPVTPTPAGLPAGLAFPAGLLVSPLGTTPLTITELAATPANAPPSVYSGWIITPVPNSNCDGAAGAAVLVYNPTETAPFDAQTYPGYYTSNPTTDYFFDPANMVWGLDLQWATEQILFFNLGSPTSATEITEIYDSNGMDRGPANNAWEVQINCTSNGCPNGASLQLPGGILYTASAALVGGANPPCTATTPPTPPINPPTPANCTPDGGPALNEFVYNVDTNAVGHLYPPPGWLAGTATALSVTPNSAKVNSSITFQATVTVPGSTTFPATAGSTLTPTSGSVKFSYGTTTLGTVALNASGVATLALSNIPVGAYSVTATYIGNTTYAASSSSANSLTITPPAPAVTMSFNPTTIATGKSTTLTWSSTNATTCSASGAWSGSQAVSGTLTVTPTAAGSPTYTLMCTGDGGSGSNSATLTVVAAPTVTVSVSPTTITVGQSATVTWSSANATTCTGSGAWSGNQALTGTLTVMPSTAGSMTYTLACVGSGDTVSKSTTLTVNAAPHSGGGAIGLWELLGLSIIGLTRLRGSGRANARNTH